jgi:hypothetical protein
MSTFYPAVQLLLMLTVPCLTAIPLAIPRVLEFARQHWIAWLYGLLSLFVALAMLGGHYDSVQNMIVWAFVVPFILLWNFVLGGAIWRFYQPIHIVLWIAAIVLIGSIAIGAIIGSFEVEVPDWTLWPARYAFSFLELTVGWAVGRLPPWGVILAFGVTSMILFRKK